MILLGIIGCICYARSFHISIKAKHNKMGESVSIAHDFLRSTLFSQSTVYHHHANRPTTRDGEIIPQHLQDIVDEGDEDIMLHGNWYQRQLVRPLKCLILIFLIIFSIIYAHTI